MSGLAGCIFGTAYTMTATLLRQVASGVSSITEGYYKIIQDPITGEIQRDWQPVDPNDPIPVVIDIPCVAEAIVVAGFRGAATIENWSNRYRYADWIKITYDPSYKITNRDRLTSIRTSSTGVVIWQETEQSTANTNGPDSVFEVVGITPITDPFGRHIQNVALLQRAEVQAE